MSEQQPESPSKKSKTISFEGQNFFRDVENYLHKVSGSPYQSIFGRTECLELEKMREQRPYILMTTKQFHFMAITAMYHISKRDKGYLQLYSKNKFVTVGSGINDTYLIAVDCVSMSKDMPMCDSKFDTSTAEEWIQADKFFKVLDTPSGGPTFVLILLEPYEICVFDPQLKIRSIKTMTQTICCQMNTPRGAEPFQLPYDFESRREEVTSVSSIPPGNEYPFGRSKRVFIYNQTEGFYMDLEFPSPTKDYNFPEDVQIINELRDSYEATIGNGK